jgi:hypothetical protein
MISLRSRNVFVIPAKAGIQGLNGIAFGDPLKGFSAARRAAAGSLSLLVQRKGTERKHARSRRPLLRFSGKSGSLANSLAAQYAASLEHGARSLRFSPAMLGGGYGSQRQGQHRYPAHPE